MTALMPRPTARVKCQSLTPVLHALCFTAVIGMREQVAMGEHIDPDLAISTDSRGCRLLQDLPWRYLRKDDSTKFEIIPGRLPGEFEAILKSLDDPFAFELV